MEFFQWTLDLEIADIDTQCKFVVKPCVDAQYWFDSDREQTASSRDRQTQFSYSFCHWSAETVVFEINQDTLLPSHIFWVLHRNFLKRWDNKIDKWQNIDCENVICLVLNMNIFKTPCVFLILTEWLCTVKLSACVINRQAFWLNAKCSAMSVFDLRIYDTQNQYIHCENSMVWCELRIKTDIV